MIFSIELWLNKLLAKNVSAESGEKVIVLSFLQLEKAAMPI